MTRRDAVGASHLSVRQLERYVAGAAGPGPHDAAWTVEAHLESCPECRRVLAAVVDRTSQTMTALLGRVQERLAVDVRRSAQAPPRSRRLTRGAEWLRSWTGPATVPRVLMTLLVVAVAVGLDLADTAAAGRFPSLVLLVAPVAPLVGVSAAWSGRLDPAYEAVAASPRAGLDLVLRRTLAVLAVVIPALAAAGALVGVSPARWLLPCLAFTAGALALGEIFGLRRAARGLIAVWVVAVAGPSLVLDRVPAVLEAVGQPAWLAVLVGAAVLLVIGRRGYTRPAHLH